MQLQTGEDLLDLMRGFQIPSVLAAAAELDVFNATADTPQTAQELAVKLGCNERAMTILLDALSSVGVLAKTGERYALASGLVPFLVDSSPQSVTAMLRHQANCVRRWARLAWAVQSGGPIDAGASVRGAEADQAAFIEAMNVVSILVSEQLIREINPGGFRCVLDIGGASGTWTLNWLQAEPTARAILFDLPEVIPMARDRIERAGFSERVDLVAGDYNKDAMPRGADLVWVSAIIHQNSPTENRSLYGRIAEAIEPGGVVMIRDVVMEESRTTPVAGALFAVNMLVGTDGGSAFTLAEIREDLESAGFADVELVRRDEGMHSVVSARWPVHSLPS
ncbi:MAG: methyltransferase domain-containing protein [Planctomycetes bacterium]|nr:methyltransferase domain-containing protein [Planctomycetota bacterium]MBL7043010.1 methyltransferase domain-containing protein [Pirellulaceae bacterium]